MTIPCNKNITKQLNSYSYVIAITLQGLLQRTKRALTSDKVWIWVVYNYFDMKNHYFLFYYLLFQFSILTKVWKTITSLNLYRKENLRLLVTTLATVLHQIEENIAFVLYIDFHLLHCDDRHTQCLNPI